jgi:5-methylcytosine-specific restriction endonuclease McrA
MWSRKGENMKKKSSKLARLERTRRSVFYDDLTVCSYCGSTYQVTKHEIFEGRNRTNSMQYGFILPLCLKCHRALQDDFSFNQKWKQKSQEYFEKYIGTRDDFLKIFRRNYL